MNIQPRTDHRTFFTQIQEQALEATGNIDQVQRY